MQMKMYCTAPLHLFCSRYATLLFLVFTISISCLPPLSQACPESFHCGDQTFPYPFGEKNSGCGDPALQLDCGSDVNKALIDIGGYQYYILPISDQDWEKRIITIIGKNQWTNTQRCNPIFNNYTWGIWSSVQFSIAEEYKNVTLWEGCSVEAGASPLPCNDNWYINSTEDLRFGRSCKSNVTVPVPAKSLENFTPYLLYAELRIFWNTSEYCAGCESNKKLCVYNVNNPRQMSCESGPGTKCKPSLSIILGSAIGSGALLVMGALLMFVNRKRCLSTSVKPDISNVEKFLQDYVHQMPCRYS